MKAVITADIVNSQNENPSIWLPELKGLLNIYGKEPRDWEIYRGDSFQLILSAESVILAAIHIKSRIKQIKDLDVRVGIGLGEVSYRAERVTESNGEAFVNSGSCFEALGKESIGIKSANEQINNHIGHALSFIDLIMQSWTKVSTQTVASAIENPDKNQKQLAALLKKSQSNISEILNRAGYAEILKTNQYYLKYLKSL